MTASPRTWEASPQQRKDDSRMQIAAISRALPARRADPLRRSRAQLPEKPALPGPSSFLDSYVLAGDQREKFTATPPGKPESLTVAIRPARRRTARLCTMRPSARLPAVPVRGEGLLAFASTTLSRKLHLRFQLFLLLAGGSTISVLQAFAIPVARVLPESFRAKILGKMRPWGILA